MLTAYYFLDQFREQLNSELNLKKSQILHEGEGFLAVQAEAKPSVWAQQVCSGCEVLKFESIGEAAKKLLSIHRGPWMDASVSHHRRSALIAEKLRVRSPKPLAFLAPEAQIKKNVFCLLSQNSLLYSMDAFPYFPRGEIQFEETKEAPSRAYLKLWEFFSVYPYRPKAGQVCLDMGSCPGGWTWVLSKMNCHVISVDKAPLQPQLLENKNIKYLKKDAFSLDPKELIKTYGAIDWFFSDIICEPKDLLQLVRQWMSQTDIPNYVCTVKFKGDTDLKSLEKLLQIPESQAKHLFCNKHEVTWFRCQSPSASS